MKKIAKLLTSILLVTLLVSGVAMGEVIKFQSFESGTDDWSYTPDPATYSVGTDVWAIKTAAWHVFGSLPSEGLSFWGMLDLANSNGGTLTGEWSSLTFASVDVSAYTSVTMKFDYEVDGYDSGDDIKYEAFFDAVSQGEVLLVDGIDNINSDGTVTINVPDVTNAVYIVVSIKQNGTDYGALDNFKVEGLSAGGIADPTALSTTVLSSSQINLTWANNGNGDDVLLVFNTNGTFDEPVDGETYSGAALNGTVLYQGNIEAYNHTSLSANTQYFYKAWSVDGAIAYSSGVTTNTTTAKAEPAAHPTLFASNGVTATSIKLDWTDATCDGYLLKASGTSLEAIVAPVDGVDEADDETLSDGSGVVSVPFGDETYTWTGLDASTTYYFKLYPFNNTGGLINYKTDGVVPSVTESTSAAAVAPDLIISEVADPADNFAGRFVELYNASASTIDFASTTVYFCREANGDTESSIQLTGTLASGASYVIGNASNVDGVYGAGTTDLDFGSVTGNGDDGYFLFLEGDHTTGTLFDAYGVFGEDGTGLAWEYEDARAERKATVTEPNATWTAAEWTITDPANVADMTPGTHTQGASPITLAAFTAKAKAGVVELAWETASETNNASFVIYRNNEVLATVEGAGTTSETNNYVYTDASVVPGVTYTYVLADVDYANNETKYEADAVSVTLANDVVEADFVIGAAYPNPFNPTAVIPVNLTREAVVNAKIYTLTGREIATIANGTMNAGSHDLRISANNMTTGLYLVKVMVENVVDVQKIAFVK